MSIIDSKFGIKYSKLSPPDAK